MIGRGALGVMKIREITVRPKRGQGGRWGANGGQGVAEYLILNNCSQ